MSEPTADPPRRSPTAVIWGILAVFLVFGAVGLAAIAYGVTVWPTAPLLGLISIAGGLAGAFLAFLFTAGILYRIDRYRGANRRTVALFE